MIQKNVNRFIQVVFIALTACTSTTDSSLLPSASDASTASLSTIYTVVFPRQEKINNGERVVMDGEIEGTIVLVDNCIRVFSDEANTSHLLIWPPDFNLINENDTIELLNGDGEIVAHIGDRVRIGGGEIHSTTMLDKSIQEQVPPQCIGPYWIIGDW